MMRFLIILCLVAVSMMILTVALGITIAPAQGFTGRVVGVIDGDTITVLDQADRPLNIRLAQIDAPELDQPYGVQAKRVLTGMILGKNVKIWIVDTDHYGRKVGRVFLDEVPVNDMMIAHGAAWAYRRYLTDEYLIQIEEQAGQVGQGLWHSLEEEPIPPWIWRESSRIAEDIR